MCNLLVAKAVMCVYQIRFNYSLLLHMYLIYDHLLYNLLLIISCIEDPIYFFEFEFRNGCRTA